MTKRLNLDNVESAFATNARKEISQGKTSLMVMPVTSAGIPTYTFEHMRNIKKALQKRVRGKLNSLYAFFVTRKKFPWMAILQNYFMVSRCLK